MKTLGNKLDAGGVLAAIGNTPLIKMRNLSPENGASILAKFEGANPGGSIKDRPALYMLRHAIESGELTPDRTILEPTSGNTGIGLAMVGVALGFRVKLCMPQCVSMERRSILEAFGAELVLTPGCEGTDGAIVKAHEMLSENPSIYYMPNQFSNEQNILSHYETTAREIIEQTGGKIAAFVAGLGTTGTIMGISRRLREYNPDIKIFAVEPAVGHAIQGLKNMSESIVPAIYDPSAIDEIITVGDEESFDACRELAAREGLFCGMSSGAAMVGAQRVSQRFTQGNVVTILPDRGDRYLSTSLYKSICAKCPP